MLRPVAPTALSIILGAAVACGGSEPSGPEPQPQPDNTPASIAATAGGNETVRIGTAVTTAPAATVRNEAGTALAGISVTFSVEAGSGTVTGATATTDGSGVARVGSWTVGSTAGENRLKAVVTNNANLSTTFTVTARLPYWTMMVYIAADNNLALAGIHDIDEMEAAGFDPEVQVVVQAEFSPTYLAMDGCDASCFSRPNFNTFRYIVTGQGSSVPGPDGTVADLGNRNMTDPSQLRDFIMWGKQNRPAERYVLVLWNHGGGYIGLLEDQTSAGSAMMSIGDLPTALSGVGAIDVLDFDMCLMGGYETLAKLTGLASYAVFSQANEPGRGNPYKEILDAIQASPTADAKTVAGIIVDQFDASYQGTRSSTTKSAYDLGQFSAFESALNTLAGNLRTNLPGLGTAVGQAASVSQAYQYPFLKDLVNFLDSLRARMSDPALLSQIDAVRSHTTGSFRVRSRFHNDEEFDVSRSNGLSILITSGGAGDQLPDAGPGAFSAYQALYPDRAWTLFLADWLASQGTIAFRDQGNARFEAYLVWDSALVSRNGDVDLWVLEPNGDVFIPFLGSVATNGVLTDDSYYVGTFYEGYLTNRFVQIGEYKFYANLYEDPQNYQPVYDIQYRNDQVSALTSLYAPNYPQLSLQVSWLNDPTPTFTEADAGAYTDLQLAAVLTVPAAAMAMVRTPSQHGPVAAPASTATHEVTSAQLATVHRVLAQRAKSGSTARRGNLPSLIRPPRGGHQ